MNNNYKLVDIPGNEVQKIINDFRSEGCIVTKERQQNGKWTITAQCPTQSKTIKKIDI